MRRSYWSSIRLTRDCRCLRQKLCCPACRVGLRHRRPLRLEHGGPPGNISAARFGNWRAQARQRPHKLTRVGEPVIWILFERAHHYGDNGFRILGLNAVGGGGGVWTCADWISKSESKSNGTLPVNISYRVIPIE